MEPKIDVGVLVHLKSNPETAMTVQELQQEALEPNDPSGVAPKGRVLVRVVWLDADLRPAGLVVTQEMIDLHRPQN